MLGNKGMQICFIRKLNQTITAVTLKKAAPYLEEAVALSPERAEIAKVLGQVKAAM